jgi:acyl-CoA thioesterase-1
MHRFQAFGLLLAALFLVAPAALCASARAEPLRLVALGDSLTAGYQLPADAAYPVVLQRALKAQGVDAVVENAGVSGDTASGGRDRLDWAVPEGTQGVIVALGANDFLRGIDPAITRAALDEIITRLKARGIGVILFGQYAPRNMGEAYVRAFDSIYPDLAKKHGVPLHPFFLDGVYDRPDLQLPDRLHPNRRGVETMVERSLPAVAAWARGLPKG